MAGPGQRILQADNILAPIDLPLPHAAPQTQRAAIPVNFLDVCLNLRLWRVKRVRQFWIIGKWSGRLRRALGLIGIFMSGQVYTFRMALRQIPEIVSSLQGIGIIRCKLAAHRDDLLHEPACV